MMTIEQSPRHFLALSIKHTEYRWSFGKPCKLWGHRTRDDEQRSFGGYTQYPGHAELYSLQEWQTKYGHSEIMKCDEPVKMCPTLCKKWKSYDTVLVDYHSYLGYCMMCGIPIKEECL